MGQSAGTDREALAFVSETRSAFAAIAAAHDLVEIGSDLYSVAYHGPPGWLTVIHDRLSYELDIAFAPSSSAEDGRPFGMADLIRVVDPAADRYRCFAATTASGIRTGIERLAHDLGAYGERALAGDPTYLAELETCRRAAIDQFARDRSSARNDVEAAEAVRREDWKTVVALYEPVEDGLNRVESKRLEFARKRLAEG